jgi:hypothetical protein
MRIAHLGLGILLVLPAGIVSAQSSSAPSPAQTQTDPLAAAAKRTRTDVKDQSKPARVWDNDTIPKAGQEISVVGQNATTTAADGSTPGAAADGTAPVANGAAPAPTAAALNPADETARIQAQLGNAKEKLASLKTDLDLMQRTLVLDSQMYYGKPDYSNDRSGARKLAAEQANIAEKQQAIDEQEKKIDDLQTQLQNVPGNTPPPTHD